MREQDLEPRIRREQRLERRVQQAADAGPGVEQQRRRLGEQQEAHRLPAAGRDEAVRAEGDQAPAHRRSVEPLQRRSLPISPPAMGSANARQPLVARSVESREIEPALAIGRGELGGTAPRVPLETELGEARLELGAAHAVVARIGTRAFGESDLATRHRLADDLCELADPVVLLTPADVEGLGVDGLARRAGEQEEGPADVFDVHQGTPRGAVALQDDPPGGHRPGHQVVEHDVDSQARRDAVGRGVAQHHRREGGVGKLEEGRLELDLGDRVGGDRGERRLLVELRVAPRGTVVRARRGEEKTRHAGLLGQSREPQRTMEIDVVGQLGVEVAERVVRQRPEMDDGIEALEVGPLDFAQIAPADVVVRFRRAEAAGLEEAGVEPDDLVTGLLEERYQHGADVTVMSGDENAHGDGPFVSEPSTARRF